MTATSANIRLDGYIRVSQTRGRGGDSFISPRVQRESIQRWADARGVHIAAWHEDLDQSGGKLNRPGLDAMLARIHTAQTGGLAVAHLDRLSRAGEPIVPNPKTALLVTRAFQMRAAGAP